MWWLILCVDWATGAHIFDQTLFWVFLWGYFWMRLTFESVDWEKQTALPNGWASSNQLKAWLEQKGWPLPSNREFLLPDCLWASTSVFPAFTLELKHQLFLNPAGLQTGTAPSVFLGLQLADSPLSASIITWANFLWWTSLCVWVCEHTQTHTHTRFSFSGEPWMNTLQCCAHICQQVVVKQESSFPCKMQ